ncbi:MAG: hypothetical protein ABI895_29105 [Deltaproteobacteria bacterium]
MAPRAIIRVARKVSRLLAQQEIPHALAGGLAVGLQGYNRMTMDVDFVIPKSARSAIEQLGLTTPISGQLRGVAVQVDRVDVHFLFVGKPVRQRDIASPVQLAGFATIALVPLVAMKMGAGRHKATIDVVALLKLGKVPVEEVEQRLAGEHLERFHGLVAIADYERKGKPKKGRRILIAMLAKAVGINHGQAP